MTIENNNPWVDLSTLPALPKVLPKGLAPLNPAANVHYVTRKRVVLDCTAPRGWPSQEGEE